MINDNTVHNISEEKPLSTSGISVPNSKVVRHPSNKQMPDNKGYYLDIHHDSCTSCDMLSNSNLKYELQRKENEKLLREIILLKRKIENFQKKQVEIEAENTSLKLAVLEENAAIRNFRESLAARQNYKVTNQDNNGQGAKRWADLFFLESEFMLIVALVFLVAIVIFGMPAIGKFLQSLF